MRILLLVLALSLPVLAKSPDQEKKATPDEVSVMRLINTVYVGAAQQLGHAPSWDELVRSTEMKSRLAANQYPFKGLAAKVNANDPANFFPGHKIRWTVSADGKSYDVAIMPEHAANDYCSAPTLYSNNAGVIYQAYSLDCHVTAAASGDTKAGD